MIIKIGIMLLVFIAGYRMGEAAGLEKGFKKCVRELRNLALYLRSPEDKKELRNEDIQKGLNVIYGKEQENDGR